MRTTPTESQKTAGTVILETRTGLAEEGYWCQKQEIWNDSDDEGQPEADDTPELSFLP